MPTRRSSRARRSSRSWATSTTARRRCSTRSAAPTSSRARPAASPSTSAPIRCSCPTSRRSPSSTRRATKPSPRCAPAAPTSPTSSILVVAADDGLKPQTIEAINHTKAAGVPMIVAINKIDKPDAKPQKVREELLQHEVIVEDMGGEVQDVEVSALKKTNLDKLLEAIAAAGRNPRAEGQSRPRRRRHGHRGQARQGPRPARDRARPARHAARRRRVRRGAHRAARSAR